MAAAALYDMLCYMAYNVCRTEDRRDTSTNGLIMWPRQTLPERARGATSTSGRQQHAAVRLNTSGFRPRRAAVAAQAAGKQRTPGSSNNSSGSSSRRNSQLYELFDDDGWGVEVAGAAPPAAAAAPASQQPTAKKAARQRGTPYVDMRSEEGVFGLTLLQKALIEQHEAATGEAPTPASVDSVKAIVAAAQQAAAGGGRKKPRLPGYSDPSQLQRRQQQARGGADDDDENDGDDEDDEEAGERQPEFQITFENGKTQMTDFGGSSSSSSSSGNLAGVAAGSLLDEQGLGFEGWGEFGGGLQDDDADDDEEEEGGAAAAAVVRGRPASRRAKQKQAAREEADGELEAALINDLSNEDDWGLEGLPSGPAGYRSSNPISTGRTSLLEELAAEEAEAGLLADGSLAARGGSSVQWGGSAGATGLDLEEQEELLRRYFRPSQVAKLMAEQVEVDAAYSEFRKRAVGLGASDKKTQEKLRIVSGTAAGRKLVSFRSTQTRPMMEKVRQAIFNMIQYQAGTVNCLPPDARWLDLFAGTGSVGLEALSRGAREAHFVEMDPVVVSRILSRNIATCGFKGRAWAHTSKAEDFLRKAAALPRFAGGPFDFVSVCPPYLLVSYPELFDLLDASPLLHAGSIVFVEYPKQLEHQIRDSVGPLARVKDRKYGRTYVAVYAAGGGGDGGAGGDGEDPFLAMAG